MDFAFWGINLFGLQNIFQRLNSDNHYQIAFRDVDSLIVGSPVRIMGIQVGHVTEVKINRNNVLVKFDIDKDHVVIPHGSRVSIQFTGIAGSKSLEIEPKHIKSKSYLVISEPLRVITYGIASKYFQAVLDTSVSTLKFLGENDIQDIKKNIKSSVKS